MKFIYPFAVFFAILSTSLFSQTPNIELEQYATGFSEPLDLTHAGDERLFVAQQNGIIHVIDGDGNVLSPPFLNITDRVNDDANERGLLGLAFHPNYAENGYFYVNYTDNSGADTRIARFSVSADPNIADPETEVILLEFDQPTWNHNGGGIKFGPDGYLYIGSGDGGSGGDPWGSVGNGQNPMTLLGKMLRIDVDNGDPYAIPESNPYAFDDFHSDEIWAMGMRNPWRFSFDKETGDLWIGDVGQNEWEEIDMEPAGSAGGLNYGWRCKEGFANFNGNCGDLGPYTDPVHAYASTSSVGRSVTGGFVYRGSEFPALYGHYIYGDYQSGRIWSLSPDGSGGWNNVELMNWNNNQISSFGEDINGELYLCAHGQGRVYKITETCGAFQLDINTSGLSCFGEETGSINVDPTGGTEPYSIAWFFGANTFEVNNLAPGLYEGIVTDANGCEQTIEVEILEAEEQIISIMEGPNFDIFVSDNYVNYQWYNDDLLIEGADSSSYTPNAAGSFFVIVTDSLGCMYMSDTYFIDNIEEIDGLEQVDVSPNPFSDVITLSIKSEKVLNLSIEVLNVEGKVLETNKATVTGSYSEEMDLKHLAAGLYFIRLKDSTGEFLQRIIKN